jgi:hypothetical protein
MKKARGPKYHANEAKTKTLGRPLRNSHIWTPSAETAKFSGYKEIIPNVLIAKLPCWLYVPTGRVNIFSLN